MDIQHHPVPAHEIQVAHKVEHDVQTHSMQALRHDLSQEAHHPKEFQKVMHDVNQHLKQEHHHPLSIHHDKNGHISHIDFGKTNIYDSHHGHNQQHRPEAHKGGPQHVDGHKDNLEPSQRAQKKDMEREKGAGKPEALEPSQKAHQKDMEREKSAAAAALEKAIPKGPDSPKGAESLEYAAYRNEQAAEKMDPSLRKDAIAALGKLGHVPGSNNENMERSRQSFIDMANKAEVPLATKQHMFHAQATYQ